MTKGSRGNGRLFIEEREEIEEELYGRPEFKLKTSELNGFPHPLSIPIKALYLFLHNWFGLVSLKKKMEKVNCKRRRVDNGVRRGIKFSIMSCCDRFAPLLRLPHEIIREEVLSRLPIRDLCRAKCVCKQWRSDISSPDFIKVHRLRNHQHSHGLLIATTDSVNDEFVFYYSPLSEQHRRQQPRAFVPRLRVPRGRDYQWMTQVVNGLVCLYSTSRLSLFNICTREIHDLPLPPPPAPDALTATPVDVWMPEINDVGKINIPPSAGAEEATNCTVTRYFFGFDVLHKAYKILSLSYMCREECPGPGDLCGCPTFMVPQVLTLSGPLSSSSSSCNWRKVPEPIPLYPLEMQTLCVNGLLWWTGNKNSKICFDLTTPRGYFRSIIDDYPPVSNSEWFFRIGGIPSQYGGDIALSDCFVQGRSLRLFTRSAKDIYCEWNKYDINLPVELLRRGKSSITLVGNLPDGDILIANDQADDFLTPVYSFTPGRNKRFSKSFKVGKFPPATASMSPKELAVAVTCVQDNLTPLCDLIGNCSHL